MNKRQFDIVKTFLNLGNTPERIAEEFKAPLIDVKLVATSHNYEQYQDSKDDPMNLFNVMFGGAL